MQINAHVLAAATPPAKPKAKIRSPDEIREIGKYQRLTMWALLPGLVFLVPVQWKALDLFPADHPVRNEWQDRLALYRDRKPYHQPERAPAATAK